MREYLKAKYARYERQLGALGLVTGFVFDWLTLRRVDLLRENLWLLLLLTLAAVSILILNYHYKQVPAARDEYRHYSLQFWLIFVMQFAFGGLLSAFLVLYFRSATLSAAWPFLLILAAAFVGNEIFKARYARLSYQVSVLFLAIFSFAIFSLPVLVHRLGPGIFIFSGLVSLALISLFIALLRLLDKPYYQANQRRLTGLILGLFLLINLLYFAKLIPPIPLALKEAGLYHQLTRRADGNYDALAEPRTWRDYWTLSESVHLTSVDQLYAYSAIFSPTRLNTTVIHDWQAYDQAAGEWRSLGRVTLPIQGGRGGGYRTYSLRAGLAPGRWRVNVTTASGQLLGRIKFEVFTSAGPDLIRTLLD